MRKILFIVVLIFIFLINVAEINAAKKLPQSKSSNKTVIKKSQGAGISVAPKLRPDRQALLVYFGNLQNAQSVSYMLIYKTNGQEEGAGGSVKPSEGNATRELLFGTCSKNVCRYHPNITNMSFEVTVQLTSGKKLTKRYRIKI